MYMLFVVLSYSVTVGGGTVVDGYINRVSVLMVMSFERQRSKVLYWVINESLSSTENLITCDNQVVFRNCVLILISVLLALDGILEY